MAHGDEVLLEAEHHGHGQLLRVATAVLAERLPHLTAVLREADAAANGPVRVVVVASDAEVTRGRPARGEHLRGLLDALLGIWRAQLEHALIELHLVASTRHAKAGRLLPGDRSHRVLAQEESAIR